MATKAIASTYHDLTVDTTLGETTVHYVDAGDHSKPTLLLLMGFPSSSTQYRNFIPLMADDYHILAPDLPGFGLTKVPAGFTYTFDNLALVISAWLKQLGVSSYASYIFDYGAPVGFRLALENPGAVKAMISQNGNAYTEGLGADFWAPIMKLWKEQNSPDVREMLRAAAFTQDSVNFQYYTGVPERDRALVDPQQPRGDYVQNLTGKENQDRQLDLFYDYRTNVAAYPTWQSYLRESQVPLLAVWGKGDPCFVPAGAEAFKRDVKGAEVHFVSTLR